MLDRAVLAGGIHRLEDEQQRPAVLGVEHVLLFREPLGAARKQLGRLALAQLEAARIPGIEVLQTEALALGDTEGINVLLEAIEDLSSRHGADPFRRRDRRAGQLYQLKQQLARHCKLSLRAVHQDQPQRAAVSAAPRRIATTRRERLAAGHCRSQPSICSIDLPK